METQIEKYIYIYGLSYSILTLVTYSNVHTVKSFVIFGVLFSFMTLIYAKSHWLFLTHWKSSLDLHISQTFQPKRSRRKGRVWKRGVAVLDVKFTVKNLPFLHCKTARKFIFIEVMSTHAYCVWASIKVIFFTQKEKKVVGILFAGQG